MTNIVPFAFQGNSIRVIDIEGEPWFVGKDVATALAYANPQDAVRRHCKRTQPVGGAGNTTPLGLDPQTTIIPEGDVYRLIVRSHLPSAEAFEQLIMDEILPAIRKTGKYEAQQTHQSEPQMKLSQAREVRLQAKQWADFGAMMNLDGNQLAFHVSHMVKRVTGVSILEGMQITHVKSDSETEMVNVTDLGKLLGCSSQEMNLRLISAGLQTSYRNTKGKLKYEMTEEGRAAGGKWHDVQKVQGGRPVMQLLWPTSLVDALKKGGAA